MSKKKSTPKTKLWKVFSVYIRMRDRGVCFTCGIKKHWKKMQAGHYRTGATCKLPLFFEERNVNCQCFRCNINLSGNWRVYQKKMRDMYGEEIDHEFDVLNQWNGNSSMYPFQDKMTHYKQKITELEKKDLDEYFID